MHCMVSLRSEGVVVRKVPKAIFNPRRACTAMVTVLGLCVCVCVCVFVSTLISELQETKQMVSDTNGFSVTSARKIKWRFS